MENRAADLTLSVHLEELAAGRRVLWVGDVEGGAPDRLSIRARTVRVLSPGPGRGAAGRRRGRLRISELRPGPLSLPAGSFGLIVLPEVALLGEERAARLVELAAALDEDGVLVAATAAGGDGLGYESFYELVADRFPEVRVLGVAPFRGYAVAELGRETAADVLVDGTLVPEPEDAERFVALCARVALPGSPYTLVQLPSARPGPVEERAGDDARVRELEDVLHGRQLELDAAVEHAEALEAAVAEQQTAAARLAEEIARLRAAPAPAPLAPSPPPEGEEDEAIAGEHAALEARLVERGRRVAELEQEVERRGAIVRDVLEELRQGRVHTAAPAAEGPSAAVERALEAEAALAEVRFELDELRARLAETERRSEVEALKIREAELSGRVRGLIARAAELAELRELVEARLRLTEDDLASTHEYARGLEREIQLQRDHLELELVRAQGAPPVRDDADREQLVEERDLSRAEAVRLTSYVSTLETRLDGMRLGYDRRIAELLHDTGAHAAAGQSIEADLRRLGDELAAQRGERDGLRFRLADREQALALREPIADPAAEAEVGELRHERDELWSRVADAEDGRERELRRAEELADAVAARDALVARLHMELSEEEQSALEREERVTQLIEENQRLRQSMAPSERRRAEERLAAERDAARDGLREVRRILEDLLAAPRGVAPRGGFSADGIEGTREEGAPEADERLLAELREKAAHATAVEARCRELEREVDDRETMLRSLTAQLEERNERITFLERRLHDGYGADAEADELRSELLELQERVARLDEELAHEREARRSIEIRSGRPDDAETRAMREAVAIARSRLEQLLGDPHASSEARERVGSVLQLLGQF